MERLVDGANIDRWLRGLRDKLGGLPGFAGMWLHGSAATGDWVAGVSDVDLLIGWNTPLQSDERTALGSLLEASLRVCPGGNADIHVVTLDIAAHPLPVPWCELYIARHPVDSIDPVRVGSSENSALLLDFAVARASGVTIAGPPARDAFGGVPHVRLLAVADAELAEWESYDRFLQPHMAVLQAARAWLLAEEGRLASKLAAGRWALERWPHREVITAALARQLGDSNISVDETDARTLIAHVRDEIGKRTEQSSPSPA